jgi:predicted DNA-binding protein (UPF0251 family)
VAEYLESLERDDRDKTSTVCSCKATLEHLRHLRAVFTGAVENEYAPKLVGISQMHVSRLIRRSLEKIRDGSHVWVRHLKGR